MSDASLPNYDRFPTSGCPRILEWYRCYEDPSQNTWLDGMEYRNHPEWDDWAKDKWRFLYRPIRALVGRPQKKMIREAELAIETCRQRVREIEKTMIRDGVLAVIALGLALWIYEPLALLPLLGGGIRLLVLRHDREKERKKIEGWEGRVVALRQEIAELVSQIPSRPTAEEVGERYGEEVRQMERMCFAEVVSRSSTDEHLFDEIGHEPLQRDNPYGLHGLLIEGWGALQRSSIPGPLGPESSGLNRMIEDLGRGLTTWRRGAEGQPIYRVAYLQYIFLLEKNVNIYAFFYDFVTGKRYGKRAETFQYNHVSNYSVREIGLEEEDWIAQVGMPPGLRRHLFDHEVNAFTLAVSSGAHLRCVLVDETVVRSINDWLRDEATRLDLEMRLLGGTGDEAPDQDRRAAALDRWEDTDSADRQEIYRELHERLESLETQGIHVARRVLQQIRDAVERYVQRVEGAA